MTAKLTKSQVVVLRELEKPGMVAFRYRSIISPRTLYWRVRGVRSTPEMKALLRKGFANITDSWTDGTARAEISSAGRAYLSQLDAAPEGVTQ